MSIPVGPAASSTMMSTSLPKPTVAPSASATPAFNAASPLAVSSGLGLASVAALFALVL
jgi:hypothetical protein